MNAKCWGHILMVLFQSSKSNGVLINLDRIGLKVNLFNLLIHKMIPLFQDFLLD